MLADLEVFPDEMKDIILSANSLNVADPVVTEPESHTPSFEELYCFFQEACFCARRPLSNNFFFWAQPADFQSCFSAKPCGEI